MERRALGPYRHADVGGLIAPDHRRRNTALLLLGGMLSGAMLALTLPLLLGCVIDEADRSPHFVRSSRTMIDARSRARAYHRGSLTVICEPKCSSIIDNGEDLGPGHVFNRPATAGHHRLVLHAPNGVAKSVSVEVVPQELREVRISMD